MAELADPLMGAMVDEGRPTKQFSKQHSFVRWGAVVVCAANEASRDWMRDKLTQLVP